MKLVCPSCESGFLVDATAIGPKGRKVRCGRCGNSWLAMPVEAIPDEAPAPSQTPAFEHEDQPADAVAWSDDPLPKLTQFDEPRRRSRGARRMPRLQRNRPASLGGWALFALVAAVFVAGVVVSRQQIMAFAPATGSLYALVGLADEPPLPTLPTIQLRLQEVTSNRRQVNGTSELIIEGKIFNPTDEPQDVPPLVATLMDPTGIELKRWVFAAESETLPPGGRVSFQTSTQNPPGHGNLNLNFVPQRP